MMQKNWQFTNMIKFFKLKRPNTCTVDEILVSQFQLIATYSKKDQFVSIYKISDLIQ